MSVTGFWSPSTPTDPGARPPGHRRSARRRRKCWQTDRLFCLHLLERARLIVAALLLFSMDAVDLNDLLKEYDARVMAPGAMIQLDRAPESAVPVDMMIEPHRKGRNIPKRILLLYFLWFLSTLLSAISCSLADQVFPLGSTVSNVGDLLSMSLLTCMSFFAVLKLWRNRFWYARFVTQILRNLIELPGIYCQPVRANTGSQSPSSSSSGSHQNPPTLVENLQQQSPGTGPDQGILIFKMQAVPNRHWHRMASFHIKVILFDIAYLGFGAGHLAVGCYRILEVYEREHGPGLSVLLTAGLVTQAVLFVIFPLIFYAYYCFVLVMHIQAEHLNQFIRRIRARCRARQQLPLREELDLVRVWYSRLAHTVLDFDRLGHAHFFVFYLSLIGAMLLKSLQVNLIFRLGAFTVEGYAHFVELGIYCMATIHLMQLVAALNKSIGKPEHYIHELGGGAHSVGRLGEPDAFARYLHVHESRFAKKYYQLTFLRVTPIGKEFFVITTFFILSAVASFGSFGELILQVNHQLHLLL